MSKQIGYTVPNRSAAVANPVGELRIELRGIVYPEAGVWIAHCLELDIVAEGSTRDQALQNVLELCDYQIEYAIKRDDLRSVFRPAPPEMWAIYSRGKKLLRKKPSKPVERFEARELALA